MNDGFTLTGARQSHHRFAGADDLPRFHKGFHHHAISVRHQHRVTGSVARNVRLRNSGIELRPGGVGGGFELIVGRCRNSAGGDEPAIARFVTGCLCGSGASGTHRFLLRSRLQAEVDRVKTHQGLPALDRLAGINQTLKHLARDAKAQIALHSRRHDTGE
ncbi:hypothetical protein RS1P1_04790 [Pseudomonas moraviensis]|nr:hypothetical protein RS1P1_04790 [Pseudomonas moraviensis]